MTKVLDKATAHFRNQLSGEMKSIDVPEWECKVYHKAVTTLKEEGRVLELTQQGKTTEALAESLIMRARNEDGSKMFGLADKAVLLNEVDPKVLVRVVSQMNDVNLDDLSVGAVEKN